MALLKIRLLGDPILREKGRRLSLDQIRTSSTQKLIDDMIETMMDARGVGLAAQQVGHPLRLLVIDHNHIAEGNPPLVLVNGEIIKCHGRRRVDEGCLSIPNYKGEIERCVRVVAKGLDRNGKEIRIRASELLAQALEHEIDHTNGILYIDHLDSPDHLMRLAEDEIANEVIEEVDPREVAAEEAARRQEELRV